MSSVAWQQYLISQGAQFNAQAEATFAAPSAASSTQVFDLSSLGLIAVSGADATPFLQGQFTNDIKQVSQAAQFTGYCTAKGRLLALFYAYTINEVIYLQCPRALIPDLIKRLRMFVLRSKVVLEDVSDQYVILGLAGNDLASAIPTLPVQPHEIIQTPLGTVIRVADSIEKPRALLIVPSAQAEQTWQTLATPFSPTSSQTWEQLEIQAGLPQIYLATKEQFVPQMVNLDALAGINFKKGCYTGQEIVARTHYLGKVKRRTLLAQIAAGANTPQVGDVLHDAQQQEAGQLVRVAATDANHYWVLAECRLEAKENGEIHWQGQALHFKTLPYSLT